MRTSSGHLYLIDFGIARHFKPGQAKDTIAFGSPGYAAPEQYGKSQTTPRSDIYSLGATLHQMLTGVDPSLSPFRFAPLSLPEGKPTPIALAVLLTRMLEMDETKRPSSMSQVTAELQTIAARVANKSFVSVKLTPAQVPIAKNIMQSAQLAQQTPAPISVNHLPRGTLRAKREKQGRSVRTIAWSPDSTLLASAEGSNVIDIWNAENGKTAFTYKEHQEGVRAVVWSPDGNYIVSAGEDKTVLIWSAISGKHVLTYKGHTHTITGLAWSPDCQYIASCSLDQSVQVWSREKGDIAVKYGQHKDVVYRIAWSPDGKYISSTGYDGSVKIWEALSGRDIFTYFGHGGQVLALSWSPDGKLLASGGTNASLQVWEAMSGRVLQNHSGSGSQILSLSWSPDGKYIVSGGAKDKVQILDVSTGQQVFVYSGHESPPNSSRNFASSYLFTQFVPSNLEISVVTWSPNGEWIASGDTGGYTQVWAAK